MTAFSLLSDPIKRFIREKNWETLRPIQAAAIEKIISTDNNYILASRTASGKTEAAFLPILTKTNFLEKGVQVLYISPLKALINDQFFRIEQLCKNLEIEVTKWHGDAKKSFKKALVRNPSGIVLITPESLEAMFVNTPSYVSTLFENLKFIVLDEIHSFIGVDRGVQLTSIISRIQQLNQRKIAIIGLSATIGDENYLEAKRITGDIQNTKILLDRKKKETEISFKYFESTSPSLPLELIKDLYFETENHKVLIFPNSRGKTEEVAVKLNKLSNRYKGHGNYFAHHSSIDKEIRESIEHFAKDNYHLNFSISCTSTLELGIDIGSVDKIVQIDTTNSVSSLVQRIGRSGRKEGQKSKVVLYATSDWSFLQGLACWQLYENDFLEPLKTADRPYDILFHQMLSIIKQLSGCTKKELIMRLAGNPAFSKIAEIEIQEIIEESIVSDFLENVQNELILGLEGEKIVNSREFYSVFETEVTFKVLYSGRIIGEIPPSSQIKTGENIFLAARIWKIIEIDFNGLKIIVIPAPDGKSPVYFGHFGEVHPKIREEMLRILKSGDDLKNLNESWLSVMKDIQFNFKNFEISDYQFERPVFTKENKIILNTFTGTRINRSLKFLIQTTGTYAKLREFKSEMEIDADITDFETLRAKINSEYPKIDFYLKRELEKNSQILRFSKWGSYLPKKFQYEIVKERYFDFEGALNFLNNLRLVQFQTNFRQFSE